MKRFPRSCIILLLFFCFSVFPSYAAQKTDSKPPSVPAGLNAAYKTTTSVSLSWEKSSDDTEVKGYQVFRDGKKLVSVTKTSYTNTGLVPGHAYTYSVKAYDAAGNLSEESARLKVSTLPDYQAPSAPGALTASAVDYTSVELQWEPSFDNTGVKAYEVYRNGSKALTVSMAGCTCKSLTPGAQYVFTVRAVDAAGNYSAQSQGITVRAAADRSAPSVPSGLSAVSAGKTEITLEWDPSTDNVKVKGYVITFNDLKPATSSKAAYTFKNLIPGQSYSVRVAATDSSGNASAACKAVTVKTAADTIAPSIPTGLTVTSKKSTSVSLAWGASTDDVKVTGYNVYCNGVMIASTTRKTYTAKTDKGFGVYIYTVRACDQSGNLSPAGGAVTVMQGL